MLGDMGLHFFLNEDVQHIYNVLIHKHISCSVIVPLARNEMHYTQSLSLKKYEWQVKAFVQKLEYRALNNIIRQERGGH